jgi:hypothetical protein
VKTNPDWSPETFKTLVLGWIEATRTTTANPLIAMLTYRLGEHGNADELEEAAQELERVARGLRALKEHTKYPPEVAHLDDYVWAVSANSGRSLRVTDGEFTARRYLKLSGTNGVERHVYRMRPNGPRPAPGTEVIFGSLDPTERGWQEVTFRG